MEESAEDITAADTAPSPIKETQSGVRYCKTRGKMSDALLGISETLKLSLVTNAVRFQSEKKNLKEILAFLSEVIVLSLSLSLSFSLSLSHTHTHTHPDYIKLTVNAL